MSATNAAVALEFTRAAQAAAAAATSTARAAQATEAAIQATVEAERAQATADFATAAAAQATATVEAIARATSDAAATKTSEQLERLSQPVRPLQPGISIGALDSTTAGSLSAFVRDSTGSYFLVGPTTAMGLMEAPILQPSPLDGGQSENVIAQGRQSGEIPLNANPSAIIPQVQTTTNALSLVGIVPLIPGISFQTTIPGVGPITGVREPAAGQRVLVVGRTAGVKETTITDCGGGCAFSTRVGLTTAPFAVTDRLSPGDEGALVITPDGFAVGIVTNTGGIEEISLMVPFTAVLDTYNVTFVFTNVEERITTYSGPVYVAKFSPGGSYLAAGVADGSLHLNHLNDPFLAPQLFEGLDTRLNALSFDLAGNQVIAGSDNGELLLWTINDPDKAPQRRFVHRNSITSLVPVANYIISSSFDGSLSFTDISDPENLLWETNVAGGAGPIWDLTVHPQNRLAATGHDDGVIQLWNISDLENPVNVGNFVSHTAGVRDLEFSPDGEFLAAGYADGSLIFYRIRNGVVDPVIYLSKTAHEGDIWDLEFNQDGSRLVSGGADNVIRVWNSADLTDPLAVFSGHMDEVFAVDILEDGQTILSASEDQTVRLWSFQEEITESD